MTYYLIFQIKIVRKIIIREPKINLLHSKMNTIRRIANFRPQRRTLCSPSNSKCPTPNWVKQKPLARNFNYARFINECNFVIPKLCDISCDLLTYNTYGFMIISVICIISCTGADILL